MPLTDFPNGLSSFGMPVLPDPGPLFTTGSVFFVHSGDGTDGVGRGDAPDRPFASIEFAMSKATAGDNDLIIAMPGHVETVTSDGGLTVDVQGVRVVGVGHGDLQPKINMTTAVAASAKVTASDVLLYNLLFAGGIDALEELLHITGDDVTLEKIITRDVTGQMERAIFADGALNRLIIRGWKHEGATGAGSNAAIQADAVANFRMEKFSIDGNFANAAVEFITGASSSVDISDGFIRNRNSADVCIKDTVTGSSGKIGPDLELWLADDAANITQSVTGATFVVFDPVYVVNAVNEKAMLINWTASTHAP